MCVAGKKFPQIFVGSTFFCGKFVQITHIFWKSFLLSHIDSSSSTGDLTTSFGVTRGVGQAVVSDAQGVIHGWLISLKQPKNKHNEGDGLTTVTGLPLLTCPWMESLSTGLLLNQACSDR